MFTQFLRSLSDNWLGSYWYVKGAIKQPNKYKTAPNQTINLFKGSEAGLSKIPQRKLRYRVYDATMASVVKQLI